MATGTSGISEGPCLHPACVAPESANVNRVDKGALVASVGARKGNGMWTAGQYLKRNAERSEVSARRKHHIAHLHSVHGDHDWLKIWCDAAGSLRRLERQRIAP